MFKTKKDLKKQIYNLLKDRYPLDPAALDIGYTPQTKFGDLAMAFPFQLAKKEKRHPRELALEILPLLAGLDGVTQTRVAGGGYINLFLERSAFFRKQLNRLKQSSLRPEEKKIIIEHTNINPNKAAHIGHLRNAVLGDTLARCLQYKGENIEIQNYVDDTGIQVVDVVFGFIEMEKKNLDDIQKIKEKFDYYCWDLYTRVSSYLENHPEAGKKKSNILMNIEKGIDPESAMAFYISRRILQAHLKTMERLGIGYDILPCESSILHLHFWERAFTLLKEKGAIHYAGHGENKGCWVMPLGDDSEQEKVIVRSDGTVTYVGKDIAYQLWKFGLLDRDFYYEPFVKKDGKTLWITTSVPNKESIRFGNGSKVYNVIDTRQSYLQNIVVKGLRSLGHASQAEKSVHFSYEMVALSPKSFKELGLDMGTEEQDKLFHEVSGRKGLGIKADDLLDRLEEKALSEVSSRNPSFSNEMKTDIAHKIAVGALRYFMLKYAKNSLIIFDFEDALSFEGETGPYLQYTFVRINSIFRKLKEHRGLSKNTLKEVVSSPEIPIKTLSTEEENDFWEIIVYAAQFEETVSLSMATLEFSHLAKFAFNLSQKFNAYYHKYSVLSEDNDDLRRIRILTLYYVRETLTEALRLMGIPRPMRM